MRKTFRRFLPSHETVHTNRWLRPFSNSLLHPRLWHLNRHSAAGAVAAGLFCGLIPGPFQMLGAAIACIVFRVNLPLALITTLYSNPLTIVPLYFVAYLIGVVVTGSEMTDFVDPPLMEGMALSAWATELLQWSVGLGKPLAIGLLVFATALAIGGYFAVRALYRWHLIRAWRARSARRATRARR
ncbi:MAG: DUF2062 domain-containing protein [Azoarcus sp.]|nr:DUF2062 domain-containing protein [Azoarcus sp.]